MILIIIFMLSGGYLGMRLRTKKAEKIAENTSMGVFFVLIFTLGYLLAKDETVRGECQEIGLEALLIALASMFGSVLVVYLGAWGYQRYF